ncbi:serine hydrolase domain-containing protein [Methyloprofundus sp.]|uniref:serine hydrolase domain-containing protein n=1 Tax=Methyloprofundus sp. TaxID=2020875 RepID=UPI003D0B8650
MNKFIITFLLTYLCAISSGCNPDSISKNIKEPEQKPPSKQGKDLVSSPGTFDEVLEKKFSAYTSTFGKPVGIAVIVRDKSGTLFGQYGFDKPYTLNTRHHAASTSKTFTSAAILKLHQEGKLNIDDLITDTIPNRNKPYLPDNDLFKIPYKSQITIRQLLSHRAGVFDVTNNDIPETVDAPYAGQRFVDYLMRKKGETHTFTKEELLAPVSKGQISFFKPGKDFHYSNTGYQLLGIIVERVSGSPLDQYLSNNFLKPLHMNESAFIVTGSHKNSTATIDNYLQVDGKVFKPPFDNLSSAQADGNLVTTLADLSNWAYRLWGTNDILNSETLAQMNAQKATADRHGTYGLATTKKPKDLGIGHDGARAGFMTVMRYHPPTKSSYVAVMNILNVDDMHSEDKVLVEAIREAIKWKQKESK